MNITSLKKKKKKKKNQLQTLLKVIVIRDWLEPWNDITERSLFTIDA